MHAPATVAVISPPLPHRDLEPPAAWAELQRDDGLRLLDVRTPREFGSHRLAGSVLVPVQELAQRAGELDRSARWLVVCAHGVRSVAACQLLDRLGFTDVANVTGGLARWHACGLPIEY